MRSLSTAASATGLFALAVARSSGTFHSQLQPCPASCGTVGPSPSNWTIYHDVARLGYCNQTMLFDFAIFNPLNNRATHASIRACTTDGETTAAKYRRDTSTCGPASPTTAAVQMASWGSATFGKGSSVVSAANSLQNQLMAESGCDTPTIMLAYSEGTVVGVYSGRKIDSSGIKTLLSQLVSQAQSQGLGDTLATQVCGSGIDGEHTVGLIANTQADLSFVQEAMQTWNNATCLTGYDSATISNVTISELAPTKPTTLAKRDQSLVERSTCSYIQVVSGDSCGSLASQCGITASQFTTYNPSPTLCSTLAVGEYVCCSAGSLPNFTPQQSANGSCYEYTVQSGDYCSLIAANYEITVDDLGTYNAETWGWQGCSDLQLGQVICLSSGMPRYLLQPAHCTNPANLRRQALLQCQLRCPTQYADHKCLALHLQVNGQRLQI
jgi:chitinase